VRRSSSLARRTGLRRTPMLRAATARLAASQRALAQVRAVVAARSGGWCEICGAAMARQVHHRVARQAGGSSRNLAIHDPANLLHLCAWCHQLAETHPDRWVFGWKVHRAHSTSAVPALLVIAGAIGDPQWVLLDGTGRRHLAPTPALTT
jgi:hypothetical protein